MALDTPTMRLNDLVTLLTGTRALGPAARTRNGSAPYSIELDFQTTDLRAVRQVIAWLRDQAPYADVELASAPGASLTTVYVQIDQTRLAGFLAGQAYLAATGELWDPHNDSLAALVQHVIDRTVGDGESWAELQSELTAADQTLSLIERALGGGVQ